VLIVKLLAPNFEERRKGNCGSKYQYLRWGLKEPRFHIGHESEQRSPVIELGLQFSDGVIE